MATVLLGQKTNARANVNKTPNPMIAIPTGSYAGNLNMSGYLKSSPMHATWRSYTPSHVSQ